MAKHTISDLYQMQAIAGRWRLQILHVFSRKPY